jgi:thiamine-phosphate pyrophosphorylase
MDTAFRILDANANRAREALRVMEDVARFGLEDMELMESVKSLRHLLRKALEQPALDRGLLLSHRDSVYDQGQFVKTPAELQRRDIRDIAAAAGSRVTEALRSIEESAKVLGADPGPIERVRYMAYESEKLLLMALGRGECPQWKLCVLITESLCRHMSWLEVARAALAGGADCLQLREKDLTDRELLSRARELGALGAPAVITNDRPDIALLAGATGVHLGQHDFDIEDVRTLSGFKLLVGVSTTNPDQARAAVRAGADYCGLGPMFPTTTKDKPHLATPAYVAQYLADPVLAARPHLAIGGITPQNARELRAVGCRGIAVSSAVCSAPDPAAACRALLEALG